VAGSSRFFIYANGLLLLTVAFIPFPTDLIGEYIVTDHAAPAVVLYDSVMALQAIAWILIGSAALKGRLVKDEESTVIMRAYTRNGFFAVVVFAAGAVAAFWIPQTVAFLTAALWILWLVCGVSIHRSSRR
jgi:uncharacterized membrane protein